MHRKKLLTWVLMVVSHACAAFTTKAANAAGAELAALLSVAQKQEVAGNLAAAKAAAEAAVEQDGSSGQAVALLAKIHERLGEPCEAESSYARAMEIALEKSRPDAEVRKLEVGRARNARQCTVTLAWQIVPPCSEDTAVKIEALSRSAPVPGQSLMYGCSGEISLAGATEIVERGYQYRLTARDPNDATGEQSVGFDSPGATVTAQIKLRAPTTATGVHDPHPPGLWTPPAGPGSAAAAKLDGKSDILFGAGLVGVSTGTALGLVALGLAASGEHVTAATVTGEVALGVGGIGVICLGTSAAIAAAATPSSVSMGLVGRF